MVKIKNWEKDREYALPNGDWVKEYMCVAKVESILGSRKSGEVLRIESYIHHLNQLFYRGLKQIKRQPNRGLLPKNKYRVWMPIDNKVDRWFSTEKAAMNFAIGYMKKYSKGWMRE